MLSLLLGRVMVDIVLTVQITLVRTVGLSIREAAGARQAGHLEGNNQPRTESKDRRSFWFLHLAYCFQAHRIQIAIKNLTTDKWG